jgi:hypothetical protein
MTHYAAFLRSVRGTATGHCDGVPPGTAPCLGQPFGRREHYAAGLGGNFTYPRAGLVQVGGCISEILLTARRGPVGW